MSVEVRRPAILRQSRKGPKGGDENYAPQPLTLKPKARRPSRISNTTRQ